MFKLVKYIKKYWVFILMCIALVFVQSQSELALPDYMSDIVTNGIQSGGFGSPVSEVLSEETYNHLLIFAGDDKEVIVNAYEYKESFDENIEKDFPNLDKGYQLKELTDKQEDELESALIKPMIMVSTIDSYDSSSDEFIEMFGELPEGVSIYDMLSMMDESQIDAMLETVNKQMETMGESTMMIAAGNGVKAEYIKLGCDVDAVQTQYIITSGLKMLGIALIGTIASMLSAFASSKAGAGLARDLRKAVFEKVESFSNHEFNKFSTASLITRTTNDITQVQQLMVMMLRMVLFAPIS